MVLCFLSLHLTRLNKTLATLMIFSKNTCFCSKLLFVLTCFILSSLLSFSFWYPEREHETHINGLLLQHANNWDIPSSQSPCTCLLPPSRGSPFPDLSENSVLAYVFIPRQNHHAFLNLDIWNVGLEPYWIYSFFLPWPLPLNKVCEIYPCWGVELFLVRSDAR